MRPKKITLHKESAQLEFSYPNEESYALSAEFLRISSPSAEVRGHGPGQETLQTGKRLVTIASLFLLTCLRSRARTASSNASRHLLRPANNDACV